MGIENMNEFIKKYGFDKIKTKNEKSNEEILQLLQQMQHAGKKKILIKDLLQYFTKSKEDASIYLKFLNEKTTKTDLFIDRIHCSKLYKLFMIWFANKKPNEKIPNNKMFVREMRNYKFVEKIKINGIVQLGIQYHIIKP